MADEVVTHYVARRNGGRADATNWEHDFTVEDEISVRGNQVSRDRVRRNGKAWDRWIWGLLATGFGAALETDMRLQQCPTTLDFAGDGQLRGKAALVYRFRSPADGAASATCTGAGMFAGRTTRLGRRRIFVDGPSGDVLRIRRSKQWDFRQGSRSFSGIRVMVWDFVKSRQRFSLAACVRRF